MAAGKGTRMGGDKPKVLVDVLGRPMLSYALAAIAEVQDKEPIIVVGYQAEKVKQAFGPTRRYAYQEKQLGTGHAVKTALAELAPNARHVIVLNGDHPLVDSTTIHALHTAHVAKAGTQPITMCTIHLPDFADWRAPFFDFGRIVRDEQGFIKKIVEKPDATDAERTITEVNPSYFCFDAAWLRDRIGQITANNPKGEYYLTDLIQIAQREGAVLNSVEIPAHQALGVNTPDQLASALQFFKK